MQHKVVFFFTCLLQIDVYPKNTYVNNAQEDKILHFLQRFYRQDLHYAHSLQQFYRQSDAVTTLRLSREQSQTCLNSAEAEQ